MRKTVSIVSPSAQKCRDNFPPPLLLSIPRENGLVARKTGCPLSPNFIIINSATRSHFPPGLSLLVEYHFFSDPCPRNDQRPAGNLFANRDTNVELAIHSVSLFLYHHMMSLNIDMKIIRPWNCSGSPILLMNFWTSRTSSNVVDLGKIFHSNSIGFPSIVSKVVYCDESLNHPNCRSQTRLKKRQCVHSCTSQHFNSVLRSTAASTISDVLAHAADLTGLMATVRETHPTQQQQKKTSDSACIENKIPTHRDLRAPQLCNQRRHSNHVDPPSPVRIRFKIVMAVMTDEKSQCCVSSIFHCNS